MALTAREVNSQFKAPISSVSLEDKSFYIFALHPISSMPTGCSPGTNHKTLMGQVDRILDMKWQHH